MCSRLHCHVRTARKRASLTPKELGRLLGISTCQVVRIENGRSKPSAKVLLGLSVLFDEPLAVLFTHFYGEVEEEVLRHAKRLHDQFEGSEHAESKRKLVVLERALKRAINRTRSSHKA